MRKNIRYLVFAALAALVLSACAGGQVEDYGEADPLVEEAVQMLSDEMDVPESQIEVVEVTATDFPDASLGVPESGQMYAQVITPGYIIELRAQNETYVYHAAGERVVRFPE